MSTILILVNIFSDIPEVLRKSICIFCSLINFGVAIYYGKYLVSSCKKNNKKSY